MVYENIKQICTEKGRSIRSVELKVGLSPGAIGKWRTHSPSIDNLIKVASELEVPLTRLLVGVI